MGIVSKKVSKDYRPGSMGAAEQRNMKVFGIVATALWVVFFLIFHVGNNDLHLAYLKASGAWHVAGFIAQLVGLGLVWIGCLSVTQRTGWIFAAVALLVLSFGLYAGFSF
jgi:hypothetical protein